MKDLIPLQCPSCAGHVDPITLICRSCGLQFKMRSDGTLVKLEVSDVKWIPIGSCIAIPGFYVKDNPEQAMEVGLHKLAEKMVEQILPLMEFQAMYNMEHDDYVVYGRLRVEEPKFDNRKFMENKTMFEHIRGY